MVKSRVALAPLLACVSFGSCRCLDDQPTAIAPQIYLDVCASPQRTIDGTIIGGFEECRVDFGDRDISVKVTRAIKVTNPSIVELNFKEVKLLGDPAFTIDLVPDTIGPGLSGELVVSVRPRVAAAVEAILTVRTDANNTDQTPEGDSLIEIPLTVTGIDNGIPDIAVSPETCDFGRVPVAGVQTCDVTITNNGSRGLVLDSVDFAPVEDGSDSVFISPPGSAPAPYAPFGFTGQPPGPDEEIAPATSVSVRVRFTPDVLGNFQGRMRLRSNDPDRDTVDVLLSGEAVTPPECIARVKSVNGQNVTAGVVPEIEPLDNVIVTLEDSRPSSSNVAIRRYAWSIASRPAGSNVVLTSDVEATTGFVFDNGDDFGVDVAGEYTLRAQVYDDLGTPSVNECEVTFEAIPSQNFLVQLTWDTPDNDMDLHVTRANAAGDFCINSTGGASPIGLVTSGCSGFDCNFLTCNADDTSSAPEWDGQSGRTVGDPTLDIDDVDGFGPENINVDVMEPGRYVVGVAGYGTSFEYPTSWCTVRIYVYGRLAGEFSAEVEEGEWWEVAMVEWPSAGGGGDSTEGGGAGQVACIEDLTDGDIDDDCGGP